MQQPKMKICSLYFKISLHQSPHLLNNSPDHCSNQFTLFASNNSSLSINNNNRNSHSWVRGRQCLKVAPVGNTRSRLCAGICYTGEQTSLLTLSLTFCVSRLSSSYVCSILLNSTCIWPGGRQGRTFIIFPYSTWFVVSNDSALSLQVSARSLLTPTTARLSALSERWGPSQRDDQASHRLARPVTHLPIQPRISALALHCRQKCTLQCPRNFLFDTCNGLIQNLISNPRLTSCALPRHKPTLPQRPLIQCSDKLQDGCTKSDQNSHGTISGLNKYISLVDWNGS